MGQKRVFGIANSKFLEPYSEGHKERWIKIGRVDEILKKAENNKYFYPCFLLDFIHT